MGTIKKLLAKLEKCTKVKRNKRIFEGGIKLELEFGKYVEVTSKAKSLFPIDYIDYEKIFICKDVKNNWIARILKGYNSEYEKVDGKWLIERNKVEKKTVLGILKEDIEDGFTSWDNLECYSLEDCIEKLDGGFGIVLEEGADE